MCIPRESGLGGSRIKRRLLNGPRRAQSKAGGNLLSILRRWAYVSCRRYDCISSECAGIPVKQGGTADEYEVLILFGMYSCADKICLFSVLSDQAELDLEVITPVLDNVYNTFILDWVFF